MEKYKQITKFVFINWLIWLAISIISCFIIIAFDGDIQIFSEHFSNFINFMIIVIAVSNTK